MKPITLRAHEVRRLHAAGEVLVVRKAKDQPPAGHVFAGWCVSSTNKADEGAAVWTAGTGALARDPHHARCPLGEPTDYRWVRETWGEGWTYAGARKCVFYRSTGDGLSHNEKVLDVDRQNGATAPREGMRWRSPVVMPRWASRDVVEIGEVQARQVQAITEAEAIAAGCPLNLPFTFTETAGRDWFADLFESINGPGSWDANQWVWLALARRVEA